MSEDLIPKLYKKREEVIEDHFRIFLENLGYSVQPKIPHGRVPDVVCWNKDIMYYIEIKVIANFNPNAISTSGQIKLMNSLPANVERFFATTKDIIWVLTTEHTSEELKNILPILKARAMSEKLTSSHLSPSGYAKRQ